MPQNVTSGSKVEHTGSARSDSVNTLTSHEGNWKEIGSDDSHKYDTKNDTTRKQRNNKKYTAYKK